MYFYFYDKFIQEAKYQTELAKIETSIVDLGIKGRVEKLSLFKDARELVEDAIKQGAHTIIGVGDDRTFVTLVNIVAPYDITLGFIPIHSGSHIARLLGIPTGEQAAISMSRRLCTTVDIARAGEYHFLGSAIAMNQQSQLILRCHKGDSQFSVQSQHAQHNAANIQIVNAGNLFDPKSPHYIAGYADGKLEVLISPSKETKILKRKSHSSQETQFFVDHISASSAGSEPVSFLIDTLFTIKTPFKVSILPSNLKIIVGRDRLL